MKEKGHRKYVCFCALPMTVLLFRRMIAFYDPSNVRKRGGKSEGEKESRIKFICDVIDFCYI